MILTNGRLEPLAPTSFGDNGYAAAHAHRRRNSSSPQQTRLMSQMNAFQYSPRLLQGARKPRGDGRQFVHSHRRPRGRDKKRMSTFCCRCVGGELFEISSEVREESETSRQCADPVLE